MDAWDRVNSMMCSWILNSINPKLHSTLPYIDTTKELRDDLEKRYSTPNTPKIYQLKDDIASCKQGGLDIAEFYSKLRNMWNELANYIKMPKCSCGKCTCDIGGQVTRLMDEERTHQFLMGLNDEKYSAIRGQILAMEPLPSLERIFNIVR